VLSALVNLGYNRALAEKAVTQLGSKSGESFDALFRRALAGLAK
jgi:Holliday junction resolvasome RuvABC DNA-binding subunit